MRRHLHHPKVAFPCLATNLERTELARHTFVITDTNISNRLLSKSRFSHVVNRVAESRYSARGGFSSFPRGGCSINLLKLRR